MFTKESLIKSISNKWQTSIKVAISKEQKDNFISRITTNEQLGELFALFADLLNALNIEDSKTNNIINLLATNVTLQASSPTSVQQQADDRAKLIAFRIKCIFDKKDNFEELIKTQTNKFNLFEDYKKESKRLHSTTSYYLKEVRTLAKNLQPAQPSTDAKRARLSPSPAQGDELSALFAAIEQREPQPPQTTLGDPQLPLRTSHSMVI